VVNKVFDQGSKETMGKAITHSQSLNSTLYGWASMGLKIGNGFSPCFFAQGKVLACYPTAIIVDMTNLMPAVRNMHI